MYPTFKSIPPAFAFFFSEIFIGKMEAGPDEF
jgi:hypothetical protein